MPYAGDMIENTLTGERAIFRATGHETAGKLLEADYYLRAGGYVAAAHIHPFQEETFEVLEGSVKINIGGEEVTAVPGPTYVVRPGVAHRIVNHTSGQAHLFSTLNPALRSDELLETVWGLASDGRTNRKGYPNILQASVTGVEFRDELRLARPPRWIQDLVFTMLAPLARTLSYKGTYVPEARRRERELGAESDGRDHHAGRGSAGTADPDGQDQQPGAPGRLPQSGRISKPRRQRPHPRRCGASLS